MNDSFINEGTSERPIARKTLMLRTVRGELGRDGTLSVLFFFFAAHSLPGRNFLHVLESLPQMSILVNIQEQD